MTVGLSLVELVGAMALLAACATATPSPEPAIADRSFTTGQPCAAPCWYGLELNKSTENEVLDKLNELPFVDHGEVRPSNGPFLSYEKATEIVYGCAEPQGVVCGVLVLSDNKLKEISITVEYQLTLQSVVNQLGKPAYVEFHSATPHGQGCMVDLKWPEKGMFVRSTDENSYALCQMLASGKGFDPTTRATEISYLVDGAEIFTRPTPCGNCLDWPGFQSS